MKIALIAACAAAALGLAACGKGHDEALPKDSAVGAAMPDTAAPRGDDRRMTAPDAGATGVVPADGSQPAVAPTPPVGTAGGSPGQVAPTTDQIPPK
jgi:hypothetical protein